MDGRDKTASDKVARKPIKRRKPNRPQKGQKKRQDQQYYKKNKRKILRQQQKYRKTVSSEENTMREERISHRVAKGVLAARPDPEIIRVITDVIEDIGVDFVEDNVEDGNSTVRSTGLRNQGVEAVGYDYIGTLEGMGATPAGGSSVDKKMQKIIEDNYGWLSDALRRDFPEQFADVKGIITYNDAEDVGMEDEYQDYEVGMWDDNYDIIIVEVGAKLLDTNKVRAYAAVTVGDAQPRYDFLAHEDFDFTDARDLKKKLTKAIRKVGSKL